MASPLLLLVSMSSDDLEMRFFARRSFADVEVNDLPDPSFLRWTSPPARARRARFARLVSTVVAAAAALCVIAGVRAAMAGDADPTPEPAPLSQAR